MFVISFYYQMFSVCGGARSLFIKFDMLIWIQSFHAVVKPRTVKHMNVGYNSTGYQIVEQQSLWKGLDTINVSSVGMTDRGSILIQ